MLAAIVLAEQVRFLQKHVGIGLKLTIYEQIHIAFIRGHHCDGFHRFLSGAGNDHNYGTGSVDGNKRACQDERWQFIQEPSYALTDAVTGGRR